MRRPTDPWPEPPIDAELDDLIRETLQESVGDAEPPPQVWSHIRAEVEADRVPVWVAWWRRLKLALADGMPRAMQNAVILTLVLLLAAAGFGNYAWVGNRMAAYEPAISTGNQRPIVLAEQRFSAHYSVTRYNYSSTPSDIPKGVWRSSPGPALPAGPKHLPRGA